MNGSSWLAAPSERREVNPCTLPHPGWVGDRDYRRSTQVEPIWQVPAGNHLHAHRVDHERPGLTEYAALRGGAVLRYVGSSYRRGLGWYDPGYHVFQVLDAGPSASNWPVQVGECYEVETWDESEDAALWEQLGAIDSTVLTVPAGD